VTTDAAIAGLVARARQGDAEASATLVRGHLRAAYVVALAILRRPHDAEDLVQEALLVAFERLDECREPERFAAWLLQIVRNRARNARLRRRLTEVFLGRPSEAEGVAASAAGDAGLRHRLLGALDHLSAQQREVVLLHDLEGWTHGEIAGALGISEVNSRQHLFQARKVLRGLLQDEKSEELGHG
jgi:RNA polymerase sigma-70 factor (ECF subfamily)